MSENTAILIRHSKAQNSSPGGDRSRKLSDSGLEQSRALAKKLADLVNEDATILVSPATRAEETWGAIAQTLSLEDLVPKTVDEIYSGDAEDIVEVLRMEGRGKVTVIVGHEPTISAAAQRLAKPGQDVPWGVPTGTALVLQSDKDWKEWHPGVATLKDTVLTK